MRRAGGRTLSTEKKYRRVKCTDDKQKRKDTQIGDIRHAEKAFFDLRLVRVSGFGGVPVWICTSSTLKGSLVAERT
jgi:hypothetical protein